jgi:hypothetical protein
MQKATFTHWDFEMVWYIRANAMPRLRWENHQPVADPGADRTTTLVCEQPKVAVLLDGSGSYDAGCGLPRTEQTLSPSQVLSLPWVVDGPEWWGRSLYEMPPGTGSYLLPFAPRRG